MAWKDLGADIVSEFWTLSDHLTIDQARQHGLSVRKSRVDIESERKAYKAEWARRKYRTNREHREHKMAKMRANYRRSLESKAAYGNRNGAGPPGGLSEAPGNIGGSVE